MRNLFPPRPPRPILRLLILACLTGWLAACQQSAAPGITHAEPPAAAAPPPPPPPAPAAAAPAPPPPPVAQPAPPPRPAAAANGHAAMPKDGPPSIPRFDWPPPKASAEEAIPDKWLRTGANPRLADVADKFEKALRLADYPQYSYYAVPRGFALATQLEQIEADGTPLPGDDRWRIGLPSVGNLSLLSFIEALAHAPQGYYRAIVFIVTDAPWEQAASAPGNEWIERVSQGGARVLPPTIGALPYGEGYRARALIYEFRKGSSGPAQTLLPSPVSGKTHLDKGQLWKPLSII